MDLIMVDGAVDNGSRAFAHRLRLDLWGEHLNLTGARRALLDDHLHALSYWLQPPEGARIRPYLYDSEIEGIHTDTDWDNVDPDGQNK
jgi:hypothetical protein